MFEDPLLCEDMSLQAPVCSTVERLYTHCAVMEVTMMQHWSLISFWKLERREGLFNLRGYFKLGVAAIGDIERWNRAYV